MSRVPIPAGRKRLPKGSQVKRWTARVPIEDYVYLADLCRETGSEMSVVLTLVLRDHKAIREECATQNINATTIE